VLACVEKVLAGVNLVVVERDWLVVITEGNEAARRTMNARMRRIDLFCKLLGPLAVALIATASVPAAVYATLGMNLASVFIEYICVERVSVLRLCGLTDSPGGMLATITHKLSGVPYGPSSSSSDKRIPQVSGGHSPAQLSGRFPNTSPNKA